MKNISKNKKNNFNLFKSSNVRVAQNTAKNAPILKVSNLSKKFGHHVVLDNISFEIKKGEIIGLLGSNGAGKTTLSEIVAGMIVPDSGTIEYGMNYKKTFKEKIGMQFQQSNYPSGLTVKDIISFALNLRKIAISADELQKILQTFKMSSFYKRKVNSLSGGQKQKLNILISMIHNPDFLILDELSTGLDIMAREEIIKFTKKMLAVSNSSCLIISHYIPEIEGLCSKVMVLADGHIVDVQKISDIKLKYDSLATYIKNKIETVQGNEVYNDSHI